MKAELNEWKISAQLMDVTNNRACLLTKLSQDLSKEAIMSGVELTLCGRISDYKNVILEIKEKVMERIKQFVIISNKPE